MLAYIVKESSVGSDVLYIIWVYGMKLCRLDIICTAATATIIETLHWVRPNLPFTISYFWYNKYTLNSDRRCLV
jgi:hypothetical protein